MKKILIWTTWLCFLGVLLSVVFAIYHLRPLVITTKWTAFSSGVGDGRVFRLLFDSDHILVKFPDSSDLGNRWFAFDLANQAAGKPNPPREAPYLCVHRGQEVGVSLTGMKMVGTIWEVDWGADSVTIVGPDFRFTLSKVEANTGRQATASPSPAT